MSILAVVASHHRAPAALLDRLSMRGEDLTGQLADLTSRQHVSEAVIVSTCTRTEVYVSVELFHPGFADVCDFLSDVSGLAPELFLEHLEVFHDVEAVRHLFGVAAGLESVIVGEHEVLGQLRSAWDVARTADVSATLLNHVFRSAMEAGKRVRTETGIGRHVTSMSHAAVILAESRLGSLKDRSVVVAGAGSMARGLVDFVSAREPSGIVVANRSVERGAALARSHGGRSVPLGDLGRELLHADVLFTATSATDPVVGSGLVAEVMGLRNGRPLLMVDISAPRNVAAGAALIDGATLVDIEELGHHVELSVEQRTLSIPAAHRIIDEEIERYVSAMSAREVAPLVTAMRCHIDAVIDSELQRRSARLGALSDEDRELTELLVRGVVAKLLHRPTVELKAAAGSARGERLAVSMRELFDL